MKYQKVIVEITPLKSLPQDLQWLEMEDVARIKAYARTIGFILRPSVLVPIIKEASDE